MSKQQKQYVVRKVVEYKDGQYKVYLEGTPFKYYLTRESDIQKYSIVVIRNNRVYKEQRY